MSSLTARDYRLELASTRHQCGTSSTTKPSPQLYFSRDSCWIWRFNSVSVSVDKSRACAENAVSPTRTLTSGLARMFWTHCEVEYSAIR